MSSQVLDESPFNRAMAAGIGEHKPLLKMIVKAEKQWPKFVKHIDKATSGAVKLTGTPRLFLTETETA